jgi:hypothetical protein
MTNAKQEFLEHTKLHSIKCAMITFGDDYRDNTHTIFLPILWGQIDMDKFLKEINKEYDSGYGGQELFGLIWYHDGTWSSRGEYDGSEWWEHHEVPVIPDNLKTRGNYATHNHK